MNLIQVLSTTPVNTLFQPLSWNARVGAEQRGDDPNHLSALVQGGVGTSFDFGPWARWVLMVQGSVDETPDIRYGMGAGGRTLVLTSLGSLRLLGGIEKLFYSQWELQKAQARAEWDLTRHFEIHSGWQETQWSSRQMAPFNIVDKYIQVRYQFLF